MPNTTDITEQTAAQMRLSNKGQVISAVVAKLNKYSYNELIQILLGKNLETDNPIITLRPDKQIETCLTIIRDVITGSQVEKRVTTFTYYPNGDLETHLTVWRDANDNEIRKQRVQYYQDKRQPEIIE